MVCFQCFLDAAQLKPDLVDIAQLDPADPGTEPDIRAAFAGAPACPAADDISFAKPRTANHATLTAMLGKLGGSADCAIPEQALEKFLMMQVRGARVTHDRQSGDYRCGGTTARTGEGTP